MSKDTDYLLNQLKEMLIKNKQRGLKPEPQKELPYLTKAILEYCREYVTTGRKPKLEKPSAEGLIERLTSILNYNTDEMEKWQKEFKRAIYEEMKSLPPDRTRLCKDCFFAEFNLGRPRLSRCEYPHSKERIDLTTGEVRNPLCSDMRLRAYTDPFSTCGPEAKWFQPKN